MTELEEKKLDKLFNFIVENGFKYTMEELAVLNDMAPRTIFNRYKTKTNMERELVLLWQSKMKQRFKDKITFCNNSVEAILLIACEIVQSEKLESSFFQLKARDLLSGNSYGNTEWENCLIDIVLTDNGLCFDSRVSKEVFSRYFFTMLLYHLSTKQLSVEILSLLVLPILTLVGREYFYEIDVERLLFGWRVVPPDAD